MMKEFKYDVKLLIQSVKDRPCLWNKTLEVYKDRIERRHAWEEIFHIIDPEYAVLPSEERRLTEEHIMGKWTNIRDTFVKSLKRRPGKPKRRYILHDQMKFLVHDFSCDHNYAEEVPVSYMKEEQRDEAPSHGNPSPRKRFQIVESEDTYVLKEDERPTSRKRSRKRERAESPDETGANDIDFVEIDDADHHRLMNEDEAFFASLLPTVVKYNEDERLEFRMDVLAVMKKIKENRKWVLSEEVLS